MDNYINMLQEAIKEAHEAGLENHLEIAWLTEISDKEPDSYLSYDAGFLHGLEYALSLLSK